MRIINSCLPKMLCCSSTLFFNYETLRQPRLRLHTGLSLSQRVGLWRGCKETWLSVSLCNLCSPLLFRAAELMTRTGSVVTLEVAKQGAIYHGLATLLNQPSPMMARGERTHKKQDFIHD